MIPIVSAPDVAPRYWRMLASVRVSPGVHRMRIAPIEIACQTKRSAAGRRDRFTVAPGEAFSISCARDCYPTGRDEPARCAQRPARIADSPSRRTKTRLL